MTPTLKKILKWGGIAVAVVAIVFVALQFTGGGDAKPKTSTGGLTSTSGNNPVASAPKTTTAASSPDSQVVALLKNLSALRLEASVFSNPAFDALSDISIELQPVSTKGRRNPFAPIGGETAVSANSTTTTTTTTTTTPASGTPTQSGSPVTGRP